MVTTILATARLVSELHILPRRQRPVALHLNVREMSKHRPGNLTGHQHAPAFIVIPAQHPTTNAGHARPASLHHPDTHFLFPSKRISPRPRQAEGRKPQEPADTPLTTSATAMTHF